MMTLLDLPLELFQIILCYSIRNRGLKRGLRLRLVNTLFSGEVTQALFTFRLLDSFFNSVERNQKMRLPPFAASYLEHRVLNEPDDGLPTLLCIRNVAERLCLDSKQSTAGEHFHSYVRDLCSEVMKEIPMRIPNIFSIGLPGNGNFETDVFVAAVRTQTTATIERCLAEGHEPCPNSWLFGSASRYAIKYGNHELLARYMHCPTHGLTLNRRCQLLRQAAREGSLETAQYIFNFGIVDLPWEISGDDRDIHGHLARVTLRRLETPDIDTWSFILDLRKTYLGEEPSQTKYGYFLRRCVSMDWTEMATHFLTLGVHTSYNREYLNKLLIVACERGQTSIVKVILASTTDKKLAVEAASRYGHRAVVELLLKEKADTTGALEVAVAGGYRDIVKLLFEHDTDLGKQTPYSLPCAIESEHTSLFELLMDRSTHVDESIRLECVKRAQTLGLESMLNILEDRGWVTYT